MSSLFDGKTCPICGNRSLMSADWSILCGLCGYERVVQRYVTSGDELVYRTFHEQGYGTFMIARKNGRNEFGVLKNEIADKTILWFKEVLKDPNVDCSQCYLTKWDSENEKLVYVIGSPGVWKGLEKRGLV